MDIGQIFNSLRQNLPSSPINWLDAIELRLTAGELHVTFLNPFIYDWFRQNMEIFFTDFMEKNFSFYTVVIHKLDKFVAASHDADKIFSPTNYLTTHLDEKTGLESGDTKNYFDDFIYNEKNFLAVRAARVLSTRTVSVHDPSLLIFFGSSGSGKTHLLKAIHQECQKQPLKICSLVSGKNLGLLLDRGFTLPSRHPENPAPILLVDDLQDLEQSPTAISLVSDLCDMAIRPLQPGQVNGKQKKIILVLALNAQSTENSRLPERLKSRLAQGLFFTLQPADLDVRLRFAEKFNREKSLRLSRSQLVNIARRAAKIPDIIGLLQKIDFFVTLQGRSPSMRDLEALLGGENPNETADWQRILELVARRFELKIEDITGITRKPEYVQARQVAMYLARNKLALSFQEIGKFFGGKDHSTVMHSIKKIQQLRQYDKDMHKLLTELEKIVG